MRGRASMKWSDRVVVRLTEFVCVALAAAAVMGALGLAVMAGRFLVDALGIGS